MPQIYTSNSISLLHLVVCSAGVGIGVVGFPEAGVGLVQCRQLARQATRPVSKHNASTKKTMHSKIYCSKTNDLMQSFATILHQLWPNPPGSSSLSQGRVMKPKNPGLIGSLAGPGFLGSWTRQDQVLQKVGDRPGLARGAKIRNCL